MELVKNIFSWKAFVAVIPLVFVFQIARISEQFIIAQNFEDRASNEGYMSYETYFLLVRLLCILIILAAFLLPLHKWPFLRKSFPNDEHRVTLGNCHMLVVGGLYIALILLTMILNIGMPSTTSI